MVTHLYKSALKGFAIKSQKCIRIVLNDLRNDSRNDSRISYFEPDNKAFSNAAANK
jgi:hypothetical protein